MRTGVWTPGGWCPRWRCSRSPPRSSLGSEQSAILMLGGTSRRAPTSFHTGGSTAPIHGCLSRQGHLCSPSGYRKWLRKRVMSCSACRQAADSVPAIMAALAALVGTGGSLSERPQLVSFVLLAVTVGAWWKTAGDLRPRWWLAPMTFLWACSHGMWGVGVLLGLTVIAGLALDRRLDRHTSARLLAVPALSVVAAGLTTGGAR